MPRPQREDFPGAFHHVMNRGARRAPIFKLPDDCAGFLDHLADTVSRFGLEIHAYSLMPNQYHLLARSIGGATRWVARIGLCGGAASSAPTAVSREARCKPRLARIETRPVFVLGKRSGGQSRSGSLRSLDDRRVRQQRGWRLTA